MDYLRIAVKIAAPLALVSVAAFGTGAAARSQDFQDSGSGLRGHRFRLGLGASLGSEHLGSLFNPNVAYNPNYGAVVESLGADVPNFVGVKVDYTFFRPARQEGLVSAYVLSSYYTGYNVADSANFVDSRSSPQIIVSVVPEYRLRFFGQGIGYLGAGVGASNRGLVLNSVSAIATGAVGVDLAGFYIEARSLYFQRNDAAFTTIFAGHRF